MGQYSNSCEQRFRQLYEHDFDWMEFNTSLMWRNLGRGLRKAIAIDASYISKAGKKVMTLCFSVPTCAPEASWISSFFPQESLPFTEKIVFPASSYTS